MGTAYELEKITSKGIPSPFGLVEPFKFEPWKDPIIEERLDLPITEPPCKHCKFFRPRIITDARGVFDGVILCHNEGDMEKDFSCFRDRGGEE